MDRDTRTRARVAEHWHASERGDSGAEHAIYGVDAVLDYLGTQLADFKLPQYIVVTTDPLPRNPGGKLLKRTLRDATDWGSPVRGR